METVIEFLGFSLGAGLAIRAVDSLGGGLRPVIRTTMRLGMAAGEAVGGLVAKTGETVADTAADAGDAVAGENASRGGDSAARQIVIAHE